jgi:hypothetical protein
MPYKRYLQRRQQSRWLMAWSTIGSILVASLHALMPLILQLALRHLENSQTMSGGSSGTAGLCGPVRPAASQT